jgi:hypothetical protein
MTLPLDTYYARTGTLELEARVLTYAGVYFFERRLTGAQRAALRMIASELAERIGDEESGRFDARRAAIRAAGLLDMLEPAGPGYE